MAQGLRSRKDDWGRMGSFCGGSSDPDLSWIDNPTVEDLPNPKPPNPLYKTTNSAYGSTANISSSPSTQHHLKNQFTKRFYTGPYTDTGLNLSRPLSVLMHVLLALCVVYVYGV